MNENSAPDAGQPPIPRGRILTKPLGMGTEVAERVRELTWCSGAAAARELGRRWDDRKKKLAVFRQARGEAVRDREPLCQSNRGRFKWAEPSKVCMGLRLRWVRRILSIGAMAKGPLPQASRQVAYVLQ
jgi:hypothetical protein